MRLLSALCLAMFFVGCGSGDSDDSSDATAATQALTGTWKTGCIAVGEGFFTVATMTNTESTTKLDYAMYAEAQCLTPRIVDSTTRTYSIGGPVSGISGAWNINNVYGKTYRTYLVQENANSANSDKAFGHADWAINVAKDISGKKYNDTSEAEEAEGSTGFGIFKIDGNKYIPGDVASGNGTSEATRPTSLSSTLFMTKQ